MRRSTGGYYTRADFPFYPGKPDHAHVSGKPAYMLEPVFRLFIVRESTLPQYEEIPSFPRDNRYERLSVGKEEMQLYFDSMPDYRAVQNSNLGELLEQYTHEGMTNNSKNLARMAHRYAATMADSQVRCLLELMARVLDENNGKLSLHGPLASEGLGVVK